MKATILFALLCATTQAVQLERHHHHQRHAAPTVHLSSSHIQKRDYPDAYGTTWYVNDFDHDYHHDYEWNKGVVSPKDYRDHRGNTAYSGFDTEPKVHSNGATTW